MKPRSIKLLCLCVGTFLFHSMAIPVWPTELDPWFSEPYLPILRLDFIYEKFHHVSTASGLQRFTAYNQFVHENLEFTVDPKWNLQTEWGGASTRNTAFNIEFFRITGRYLILDDVAEEDPVSLSAGVTVTFPWRHRLRDVSLMHHSLYDTELHLAIGKEFACGPFWSQRFWMLVGIGQGTVGSPWLHGIIAAEQNINDIHQFRLSGEYLRGLGNHSIINVNFFPGYANLSHESFDLIFRYTYSIPTWFDITLSYFNRITARNCPHGVQAARIGIVWPYPIE